MQDGASKSVRQQIYLGIELKMGTFDIIRNHVSLNFCIVLFFYGNNVPNRHSYIGEETGKVRVIMGNRPPPEDTEFQGCGLFTLQPHSCCGHNTEPPPTPITHKLLMGKCW